MLGLSINHSLLVLALLLIVIDVYFSSDVLTHISYLLICTVIYRLLDLPFLYAILITVLFWFILVFLHYFFFKKVFVSVLNKYIAPDKYRTGYDNLIDTKGICKVIEGVKMIEVHGDLWNFQSHEPIEEGDIVIVKERKNGLIIVTSNKVEKS